MTPLLQTCKEHQIGLAAIGVVRLGLYPTKKGREHDQSYRIHIRQRGLYGRFHGAIQGQPPRRQV